MKRRAFLLAAASAACSRDRRPRLNVFNWSSYIAPDTLTRFSQEYGVRVRYGVYESNEEMLARVMTGNSGWDVVFPTHSRIAPMAQHGLLARIDHSRLRNLSCLAPRYARPQWDEHLDYGIPYLWNATGICYNTSLQPAPQSWSDLWNPALQARLTMLDDPEDVLGACLLKLGLPFDASGPAQLSLARREAMNQKAILRAYLNAEVRDQLVAGDVLAAQIWSTTAQQAMRDSRKLEFSFPREGFPVYADNAAILAESTRRDTAHAFLDFLLRPDIAAANARVAESATTNGAAMRLLPEEIRNSRVLYPDEGTMQRAIWPHPLPRAAQRLRDHVWTEIKAA